MSRVLFIALSVVAHGGIAVAVMRQQVEPPLKKTEPKLTFVEVTPPPPVETPVVDVPAPAPKSVAPKRKVVEAAPHNEAPAAPDQPPAPPVLGISFGSTVATGSGPALAVGSARGGSHATSAPAPAAPASGEGVNVVRPARSIVIEPPYPAELRAQGIEADVTVRLKVGPDGSVLDASVVKAAAEQAFNVSALATARRERFTPGTRDGVPVPFVITFTYRFRIET